MEPINILDSNSLIVDLDTGRVVSSNLAIVPQTSEGALPLDLDTLREYAAINGRTVYMQDEEEAFADEIIRAAFHHWNSSRTPFERIYGHRHLVDSNIVVKHLNDHYGPGRVVATNYGDGAFLITITLA